ncbi:redox-regulated ATPase YchF [Nanoarchaeota archaeon NZ13-N]|uniref:Translation-associated GTPase n=1 Tax=Candidatus Nanoclepta minutus TaxID=1940235 RepID=A0A397WP58_9ARCH|nr:MAG: redox-regulated ATPase YchF [Nanoarchaeota archaeon NZ13-N]RIB35289.1 MAG: translation-associated GTPase [Candidatus Nanoclepta minutus]
MLIGIVGKPNVGKSTFFKALTFQDVEIANYPFTTLKPNEGVAYVRVKEVSYEFGLKPNPKYGFVKGNYRFVPVKVMDVPGLVPGAHEGRGLGNKFLDDLRKANVLIHIVDIVGSVDEEGRYVGPGNYDPIRDIKWLEEEIDYWFYSIIKRNIEKEIRSMRSEKKDIIKGLAEILSGLDIKLDHIDKAFRDIGIGNEDYDALEDQEILFKLSSRIREVSKPIVIAANRIDIDIDVAKKNIDRIKREYPNKMVVPTSGYAEVLLKKLDFEGKIEYVYGDGDFKIVGELDEKEKIALEFIREKILKDFGSTGVQKAIDSAVFDVLGYIAVFPVATDNLTDSKGNVLPDCFLLPKGSKVIDLANEIHTELAKNFVRAIDIRSKKFVGRDHELRNLDIIRIVSQ